MDTISTIHISESRYLHISDMGQYGHNEGALFTSLQNISKLYGRFADPTAYVSHLSDKAMQPNMGSNYDISTITDWDRLVRYMRLYLLRTISWTPFYTGPYSRETTYILPELLQINSAGVLTSDSQPGFFVEDRTSSSFLQLPYLNIYAPLVEIQAIINSAIYHVRNNYPSRFLAIVLRNGRPFENRTTRLRDMFPNLVLDGGAASLMFGVSLPAPREFDEFLHYVLTNAFFDDIITIVNDARLH